MNSKERMIAAMECKEVDQIPCAPLVWGDEYCWKLTNKPIWEIMHGGKRVSIELLKALDEQHNFDWVLPAHWSTKKLVGKTYVREDNENVYFADNESGDEYIFNKAGHWVKKLGEEKKETLDNLASGVEPPKDKKEADDWLDRHFPLPESNSNKNYLPDKTYRELFPNKFLCAVTYSPFANVAYTLGFEPTMILLYENPSLCSYIIERTVTGIRDSMERLMLCGYDGGFMCDSFASADIMSPQAYKDVVAPFHKMVSDELHHFGLKSIMYNTGNILPFLDYIKDLGYDAILFEERIKGIEIEISEIRQKIGKSICLFGNFDSYLLLKGNKDAIKSAVNKMIAAAGPKSFVMSNGSPICDETSVEIVDYWLNYVRSYKL